MSEIIQVLEQIGQSARLQSASKEELNAFIQASDIPEAIKSALQAGAHSTLNVLLGGQAIVICGLLTPDEGDGKDEDKTPPNEDEIRLAA